MASLSNPEGGAISSSTAAGQVKITGEDSSLLLILGTFGVAATVVVAIAAVAIRRRSRHDEFAPEAL